MRAGKTAVVAAALFLAGWGTGAGTAGADPTSPPPSPSPAPASAPGPGPKTTIDHDGTFAVGSDIAPGTYSSAGPVGGHSCYWKRVGGPSGNEVLDNAMSKAPQIVQIDATDKSFKTDGCQPWQLTDAAAPNELPPSSAEAQLHGILGDLNARSRQSGGGQLP